MAISLATLRSQKVTSVYGRRLGLGRQPITNGEEYLSGMSDIRTPVTELTSGSTATAIPPSSFTMINATSAATTAAGGAFLLSNPVPGAVTRVGTGVRGTTSTQGSTAIALIRPSGNVAIDSSEGTTMAAVLLPFGTVVDLLGVSSGAYKVVGRSGLLSLTGTT